MASYLRHLLSCRWRLAWLCPPVFRPCMQGIILCAIFQPRGLFYRILTFCPSDILFARRCLYLSYCFPSGFHTRDHNSRSLFPSSLYPLPPPPSSNSSTTILLFHPSLLEKLKSAVDDCLQRSPVGNCASGKHGPIGEWDVSRVTDMMELLWCVK